MGFTINLDEKFSRDMKRIFCTCLLLLIVSVSELSAQDITGLWTGNYGWNFLSPRPRKLVVEIDLHNDSIISGMSHLYYRNDRYEHYYISGIYHRKDSTFTFTEDSALAVNLGFFMSNCLGKYKTKLSVSDTAMRQDGRWKDKQVLGCPASKVWLVKRLPPKNTSIPKIDSVGNIKRSDKLSRRETDIQHLLEIPVIDKDSIKIELYDNGVVDDDSVSVFVDEAELLSHRRISAEPLVLYLSLSHEKPIQKIRLVAENLGSIPPCTAVMIITTKHKRSEVRLSSNLNKNAAVEFFLKE